MLNGQLAPCPHGVLRGMTGSHTYVLCVLCLSCDAAGEAFAANAGAHARGEPCTCDEMVGAGDDGVPVPSESRCLECDHENGHDVACLAPGSTEVPQALLVRVARALRVGAAGDAGPYAPEFAGLVIDLIAAGVWPSEVRR